MVRSICLDCGIPIGGERHVPVDGFTPHTHQRWDLLLIMFFGFQRSFSAWKCLHLINFVFLWNASDQTRTGHILGEAIRRSDAPERQMTSAQSGILRLLTHLAMLQGAIKNQRVRLDPICLITSFKMCHYGKKRQSTSVYVSVSVTWSIPARLVFYNFCWSTWTGTWEYWGKLLIRTWKTQQLQFIWSCLESQKVKLFLQLLIHCLCKWESPKIHF